MRGLLTRDERGVIAFLAIAISVGSLVIGSGRMEPAASDGDAAGGSETSASGNDVAPLLVDVNAARIEELELLPGIGPAKAMAILALREERGAFGSIDELDEVKGIGPATLERLRPFATTGDSASQAAARGRSERPEDG